MSSQLPICIFCMATALIFVSESLTAKSPDEDQSVANYSYAVVFGTGVYKVKDQEAFVFRVPLPVDAFWSVTLYDDKGWMPVNKYNAYSFNNIMAKKKEDGSITIHFGGDSK